MDLWDDCFHRAGVHRHAEASTRYPILDVDEPLCDLGLPCLLCVFLILLGRSHLAFLEAAKNVFCIYPYADFSFHVAGNNSPDLYQPFPRDSSNSFKKYKREKPSEQQEGT